MTVMGAQRLKAELHRLKTRERPDVIRALAEARSHGDLSENADYDAAKERQGFVEGRIAEIEHKLAGAQVIDPADLDADGRVVFGATVDLRDAESGAAGDLSDRRRRRGRLEARQDLGQLADRARADRPQRGRRRRSPGARRRARVRGARGSATASRARRRWLGPARVDERDAGAHEQCRERKPCRSAARPGSSSRRPRRRGASGTRRPRAVRRGSASAARTT